MTNRYLNALRASATETGRSNQTIASAGECAIHTFINAPRYILSLAVLLFMAMPVAATTPPAKGVKAPAGFAASQAEMSKSYATGYWAERFAARRSRVEKLEREGKSNAAASVAAVTGTINAPVLLGRYGGTIADPAVPSVEKISAAQFQEHLFGTSDGTSTGTPNPSTVTEYYQEVSYGDLTMFGKAIGYFTCPQTQAYYTVGSGINNTGTLTGATAVRGGVFLVDLVRVADATVNFADFIDYYDASGDGHISVVLGVHTGADAASGAPNQIWSHRFNLNSVSGSDNVPFTSPSRASGYETNDVTPDGLHKVIIDGSYAMQPELAGNSDAGTVVKGIGVFAHELGHVFGLPDLYSTQAKGEGAGNWCVMAGGGYGGDGAHENTPSHPSAWCKEQMGWLQPAVVSASQTLSIGSATSGAPQSYKIYPVGAPSKEYYLIENRQRTGYDTYLTSPGLLVWHVDTTKAGLLTRVGNSVNNDPAAYGMGLIQADGLNGLNVGTNRGDAGDPFPGTTNRRALSFNSGLNPTTKLYTSLNPRFALGSISDTGSVMTAEITIEVVQANDFGALQITEPTARISVGNTWRVAATAQNYGTAAEASAFRYTVDGGAPVGNFTSASVSPNTLTSVFFEGAEGFVPPAPGTYTVKVFSDLATDLNRSNDTATIVLEAIPEAITTQLNYPTTSALNTSGTYTALDSLTGSAITTADFDNANSLPVDIGFTFSYNGTAYTQFVLNTNGFIKLGNLAPSTASLFGSATSITGGTLASTDAADVNLISAFNIDLQAGASTPEYRVSTSGTVGSRVCTIQFKNLRDKDEGSQNIQFDNINFQIKLYEGSNIVELVYGTWAAKSGATSNFKYIGIGLKGIDASTLQINRLQKASTVAWSSSIFTTSLGGNAHNVRLTPLPDAGRTYRFVPVAANVLDIGEVAVAPKTFELRQNYPNPFNPSTVINYQLSASSQVGLKVFDVLGREVATLVNERQAAGGYSVRFNAARLSSGVYFYRLVAGNFVQTKKMLLVK
ncbi:MAG: M6 family metalloprotease domain-containing protein [Rhizobacter sp.]|nr:M6 family metalloprotease domain-containing protein [Chlorobiales bacterium]